MFPAAGETVSQLPMPGMETLVENETGAKDENVMLCDKGVVEPMAAVGDQAAGLGVTVGGGVPVATRLGGAFVMGFGTRAKLPGEFPDAKTKLMVPEESVVDGIAAGTAVIMFPFGMVTLAEIVAKGVPASAMTQLLMLMVSGAPTLSVKVTVAADEDEQVKPAKPTTTPL